MKFFREFHFGQVILFHCGYLSPYRSRLLAMQID
jgi:hypothetical protein